MYFNDTGMADGIVARFVKEDIMFIFFVGVHTVLSDV